MNNLIDHRSALPVLMFQLAAFQLIDSFPERFEKKRLEDEDKDQKECAGRETV